MLAVQSGMFAGRALWEIILGISIAYQIRNVFMHVLFVKEPFVSWPFYRWIIPLGRWIRDLFHKESEQ